MWLSDLTPLGESRASVRDSLDESLGEPLPGAGTEHEWGLAPEQIAEAERADAMMAGWDGGGG
jgi:hypothetical protein